MRLSVCRDVMCTELGCSRVLSLSSSLYTLNTKKNWLQKIKYCLKHLLHKALSGAKMVFAFWLRRVRNEAGYRFECSQNFGSAFGILAPLLEFWLHSNLIIIRKDSKSL